MMWIKHKLTALLLALLVIAFAAFVVIQKTDYHFSSHPAFGKVKPGQSEAEVVRLLGPPDKVQPIPNQYDLSYKVPGYTFRAFTRGGTVYVYQKKKDVCYVLMNEGRVSEVTLGYK